MIVTTFYYLSIFFICYEIHKMLLGKSIILHFEEVIEDWEKHRIFDFGNLPIIIIELIYGLWALVGCFIPELNSIFFIMLLMGIIPLKYKKSYWLLDNIISIILLSIVLFNEILNLKLNIFELI